MGRPCRCNFDVVRSAVPAEDGRAWLPRLMRCLARLQGFARLPARMPRGSVRAGLRRCSGRPWLRRRVGRRPWAAGFFKERSPPLPERQGPWVAARALAGGGEEARGNRPAASGAPGRPRVPSFREREGASFRAGGACGCAGRPSGPAGRRARGGSFRGPPGGRACAAAGAGGGRSGTRHGPVSGAASSGTAAGCACRACSRGSAA